MSFVPPYANARLTSPPITASTTLSVRACRTSRLRGAPRADRTEVCSFRVVARTSIRLARLAHAISSTNDEIHISRCSPS